MDTVTALGTPFNVLSILFHEALARIDWQGGRIQSPRIQAAEARLEAAWREAQGGQLTLKEFEAVLEEWESSIKYHSKVKSENAQ